MNSPKRIGVAAVGDVLDVNTWSNIPYFFYTTGHEAGVFSEPWRLDVSRFRVSRILWNLKQVILGQKKGGYQYTRGFIEACEAQIPAEYFSSTVISFNQLFPRAESVKKAGGKIYYYIDTTLDELFKAQVYNIRIPDRMKSLAIQQETANYRNADGVVTMGRWVHPSLIDFYKINPGKLHQVLPGANVRVPQNFSFPQPTGQAGIQRDLTLGFVGKDWKRKGLPLLLEVRKKLEQRGITCKVKVIGPAPHEFEQQAGVECTGFIDKQTDVPRFIDEVSSCDFGCLLSSSEALGISTLEFLRLGVPVVGFFHQGLVDTLIDGASVRLSPSASADDIATTLEPIVRDHNKMHALKQGAINASKDVTWDACVAQWIKLIHG